MHELSYSQHFSFSTPFQLFYWLVIGAWMRWYNIKINVYTFSTQCSSESCITVTTERVDTIHTHTIPTAVHPSTLVNVDFTAGSSEAKITLCAVGLLKISSAPNTNSDIHGYKAEYSWVGPPLRGFPYCLTAQIYQYDVNNLIWSSGWGKVCIKYLNVELNSLEERV